MKTQLILLDTPIIVSDERIEKGDWYYTPIKRSIEQCVKKLLIIKGGENDIEQFKVLAGIPELPSIDFNGFEDQLGIVNIDIEVEMDRIPADRAPNGWDVFPKITNNSIKIIKIL